MKTGALPKELLHTFLRLHMKCKNNGYNDIVKTNLIFGGVKVLQVLVTIARTKIIAVLLGPLGVGIQSLLNTAMMTLFQFTNFGIGQSSVRQIAMANEGDNQFMISKIVKYLGLIVGIFSCFICIIFSKKLSLWTFGNEEYELAFVIIAIALLFESLSTSYISIFQGTRNIKKLSIASLLGSIISLLLSIPLFYYFSIKAIPYAIMIGSGTLCVTYFIFGRGDTPIKTQTTLSKSTFLCQSKDILAFGITLMAGNALMAVFNYLFNAFLNRYGTTIDVGLYHASSVCTYSAINILVAILASDYYPRISNAIADKNKVSKIFNAQVSLLLLILSPIVCFMICFPDFFLRMLYSNEFNTVSGSVQIMAISLFFRIVWHSLSYIILAQGDKIRYFVFDALVGNGIFYVGNIIGFYYKGIIGIAYSYVLMSLIVMLLLYVIVVWNYSIKLIKSNIIILLCILIISMLLLINDRLHYRFCETVNICILIFSICMSFYKVNKLSGLINLIIVKIKTWRRK